MLVFFEISIVFDIISQVGIWISLLKDFCISLSSGPCTEVKFLTQKGERVNLGQVTCYLERYDWNSSFVISYSLLTACVQYVSFKTLYQSFSRFPNISPKNPDIINGGLVSGG